MNAKQRNANRQTAEALHFAIQTPSSKNHYRCKPLPVGKQARKEHAQRSNGTGASFSA